MKKLLSVVLFLVGAEGEGELRRRGRGRAPDDRVPANLVRVRPVRRHRHHGPVSSNGRENGPSHFFGRIIALLVKRVDFLALRFHIEISRFEDPGGDDIGVDHPRTDRADPYGVFPHFRPQALAETHHAELGGTVSANPAHPGVAQHGGDVHHVTGLTCQHHDGKERLAAVDHPHQVDRHDLPPAFQAGVQKQAAHSDAGIWIVNGLCSKLRK